MFQFFFRYFLLFPKIAITPEYGALIGEFVLLAYLPYAYFRKSSIPISSLSGSYLAFYSYFILGSSLIAALQLAVFPVHGIVYYGRTLLYVGLLIWAYNGYSKFRSESDIIKKVYVGPFVVQAILGAGLMIWYYSTHNPTLNDILWNYETGIRMIPNAGLTIDPTASPTFLTPLGGSGNLLCSWALAVLVIVRNVQGFKNNNLVVGVAVITTLLTLSRGGTITIFLYLIYSITLKSQFRISFKAAVLSLAGIAIVLLVMSSGIDALPNVFERYSITFQSGNFDSSTLGRFSNYASLWKTWIHDPVFILFGVGFDEKTLLLNTSQHIVESFFLQVLVCSGLIGISLLVTYFTLIYLSRKQNVWFKSLWEFLIFESMVQWSITGGDFYSQHALFVTMTMLGFGLAQRQHSKALLLAGTS